MGSSSSKPQTVDVSTLTNNDLPNGLSNDKSNDTSVIIFSEPGFRGKPATLRGSQDVSYVENINFPNDTLSSLILTDGYSLILYADSNFNGDSKMFVGPLQQDTLDPSINKRTSSLKVFKTGSSLATSGSGFGLLVLFLILIILVVIAYFLWKRGKVMQSA
jgi:hypothetical protein